ncbi:GNAT family N-acetyltransferase [Shewanella donghaensis]|uniref:GNAT family N-acetyltransferase n=1 Tax=Shewanella donghaensis TaxID=238836 RepID=UPI001183F45D|nr:GNAT family N-acetyltransferase [Shewanella donghaensis]
MTMKMVLPSAKYQRSYHQYIDELADEERYPFPLDFDHQDFELLLKKLADFANGINIPAGYVASETYWLVDGAELVGVANLRLSLNEVITYCGGHIGIGIKPSYRGKGIGNLLMKKVIEAANSRGIKPLHIHCYKHNIASAKMIMANGGVLDSEIIAPTSNSESASNDADSITDKNTDEAQVRALTHTIVSQERIQRYIVS